MMNFNMLWISLFNTTELLGVNLGFWAAMLVCLLAVVVMNAVLWGLKPQKQAVQSAAQARAHSRPR
nr:conjugal transfer protein [Eubacterium maltosivorans]